MKRTRSKKSRDTVPLRCQQSDSVSITVFATCVIDTSGEFAAGVVDTGDKLPPVSLTPAANFLPVLLAPVAILPPVSTTLAVLVANLPPVSLIPVVHLDLQISPQICEKIQNDPNAIIRS
jgi:hypothetical protein